MNSQSAPRITQSRSLYQRTIEEPWRVMTLVWQSLCAALLPLTLRDIPASLERYLEHLGRCRTGTRERRATVFRRNLQRDAG